MSRSSSRSPLACGALLAAFLGVGLVAVLRHEPWRDEMEIWLVARDSASLGALLHNMATEGHPALWYLVNFFLTRVTRDPIAMQLANLAIGAGAALVFFRAAPFGLLARVLFCFGYFALFEFTVIARSHALQLLLLFAFCASRREGRIDFRGAALLALLSHTNLYGTMATAAVVAVEGFSAARERLAGRGADFAARVTPLALAGLAAATAVAYVWWQALGVTAEHRGGYQPGYDLEWLGAGLATLAYGAIPLPSPGAAYPWNSNVAFLLPAPWNLLVSACLGVLLVAGAVWALRHRPRGLALFGIGLAPMLTITFFIWYGSMRHHGQPFLWFLACAWLSGGLRRADGEPALPAAAEPVLVAVLALQLVAGAWLLRADFVRPFSSARAVGAWLARPEQADALLAGSLDAAVQPIAAWTSRSIYYPEQKRFGTFMRWGASRHMVTMRQAFTDATALALRESRDVLLILNRPPLKLSLGSELELQSGVRARYTARFEGAIVPDEDYHVIRIHPPRSPEP